MTDLDESTNLASKQQSPLLENIMETLSLATLHALLDAPEQPCVSIVVPAARGAYDQRQARLDLKNLVAQARGEVAKQLRPHQTDALLAPAEKLIDDASPWPQGGGGIGLYLAPGQSTVVRVPNVPAPRVMVGERFDVVPLLPVLMPDAEFHVLAMSRNHLKLYRATRHSMEQLHLPDLPKNLQDALWYERRENVGATPVGYGGPSSPDERKEMYPRYFQHIDRVLEPALFASGAPMVLAAVEREISGYRAVSHHPRLCKEAVIGNPELLTDSALHERAWEAVQANLQHGTDTVIDRFNELTGTARRSVDVNEILAAAAAGRVETLLLPATVGSGPHPHPQPFVAGDADDLVNRAAIDTLTHRGDIALVPPAAMPDGAAMAVILRWGEDV